MLYPVNITGMQITIAFLLERYSEGIGVKRAAGIYIAHDWPKSRDEQYLDFSQSGHDTSLRLLHSLVSEDLRQQLVVYIVDLLERFLNHRLVVGVEQLEHLDKTVGCVLQ